MASSLSLALDLGTTTLCGRLLDGDGHVVAEQTLFNPQTEFGSDVIRRLEVAHAGGGESLAQALIDGIGQVTDLLLRQAGASSQDIGRAAAAGNSAISLLLQQQPVASLLFPPHRPPQTDGISLTVPAVPVPLYLFPLVSGYVGGDLVAVLYSHPNPAPGTFFIDVGTNGEMALYTGTQWWVSSVAAGPAFEGGNIASGMPAGPGAICRVALDADRLALQTCDGGRPLGLCGSGLVDLIAAARRGGLIDVHGTIVAADAIDNNLVRYLCEVEGQAALQLYRDARHRVVVTQEDIRNFQLAKAAVHAGAECLLARADMTSDALTGVVVTGALGFSLAADCLRTVGLLPSAMIDKVAFEQGGVLNGLARYLCPSGGEENVEALAHRLRPYPLSGTPRFERAFVAAMDFPFLQGDGLKNG
nr:ASKHA domain-containing protein [uncultured Desulfuromonas sp.]